MDKQGINQKLLNGLQIVPVGIFVLFLFATIFPEKWWGIHSISFLPTWAKGLTLLVSGGLIILPITGREIALPNLKFKLFSTPQIVVISVLFSILCHQFPIHKDIYGDAFQYAPFSESIGGDIPKEELMSFWDFSLKPSDGRKGILHLYSKISTQFNITIGEVFKWSGTICALIFSMVWLFFIQLYLKDTWTKIFGAILGLSAPPLLIYFGHIETYAPALTLLSSWWIGYVLLMEKKKEKLLWILLISILFCFKAHPTSILLIPAWVIAFLRIKQPENGLTQRLSNPKQVLTTLLVPFTAILFVAYFFIAKDHVDPRTLENVTASERLFLPLFSPEAPLDGYNLLSLNHILDFLNIILSWSAPALFILFLAVIKLRNSFNAGSVLYVLLASLGMYGLLLFFLNPLVSMPMDWDLFSLPAPLVWVLAIVSLKQTEDHPVAFSRSQIAGLTLLGLPLFFVNYSPAMLTNRLESVGKHIFKSYYLHANRVIVDGLSIDLENYQERKEKVLTELKPFAIAHIDPVYANLLVDQGLFFLSVKQDPEAALNMINEAAFYDTSSVQIKEMQSYLMGAGPTPEPQIPDTTQADMQNLEMGSLHLLRETGEYDKAKTLLRLAISKYPEAPVYHLYQMEAHFQLSEFDSAYMESQQLIKFDFPGGGKAQRIAIHCALASKQYDKALMHSEQLLRTAPEDSLVQRVYDRLRNNQDVESVIKMFESKQ